jgi:hypothetical protein
LNLRPLGYEQSQGRLTRRTCPLLSRCWCRPHPCLSDRSCRVSGVPLPNPLPVKPWTSLLRTRSGRPADLALFGPGQVSHRVATGRARRSPLDGGHVCRSSSALPSDTTGRPARGGGCPAGSASVWLPGRESLTAGANRSAPALRKPVEPATRTGHPQTQRLGRCPKNGGQFHDHTEMALAGSRRCG